MVSKLDAAPLWERGKEPLTPAGRCFRNQGDDDGFSQVKGKPAHRFITLEDVEEIRCMAGNIWRNRCRIVCKRPCYEVGEAFLEDSQQQVGHHCEKQWRQRAALSDARGDGEAIKGGAR